MGKPTTTVQSAADAYWQDIAPDEYALLLQADAEQDEDTVFLWLVAVLIYYDVQRRRNIPPVVLRAILDKALANGYAGADQLGGQLISGAINPARWRLEMGRIVEQVHQAGGAAARGGWTQLSGADKRFIQGRIDKQLEYLDSFLTEIESGTQKLNGRFLRRSRMYNDAARGTYEAMRGRLHEQGGYNEEMRVLGKADHCLDCVDFAGRGWQPIGALPTIGESVCRTNCHCHFEYRNKAGNVSR